MEQAARVLNCQPHDVPILVAARLLKPLGNPAQNGITFFATSELLEHVQDRTWLAKVTNALNQHWQWQNARKKDVPDKRESPKYDQSHEKIVAVLCGMIIMSACSTTHG